MVFSQKADIKIIDKRENMKHYHTPVASELIVTASEELDCEVKKDLEEDANASEEDLGAKAAAVLKKVTKKAKKDKK